ncbi:MAG: hypothetical protein KGI27_08575 [Thaumarchaeota archaeon]|nr:hypothetical protein [Nitrososphaerota archaeon]
MVYLGTAKLAGVIMTISIVAIAGTNLVFAQTTSTGQPCGAQAYTYIGCTPMATAQLYGAIIVAVVVAFAIGCGAAGVKYHTIP